MPVFGSPGTYSGSYPTAETMFSPSTYVLNNPYTSGLGQATTYFSKGLTPANSGVPGKVTFTPSFTNTISPSSWNKLAAALYAQSNPNTFAGGNAGQIYSGGLGGSSGGSSGSSGGYDWGSLSGGNANNFGYPAYGIGQGWALGLGPQYSTSGLGTADWPLSSLGRTYSSPNLATDIGGYGYDPTYYYGSQPTYGAYNPNALTNPGQFDPQGAGPGYAAYGVGGGWPNQTNQSIAQSLGYGVYGQESTFGTNRRAMGMTDNGYGAIGPMQITRATANTYNADRLFPRWDTNPQVNRALGTYILGQQLGQYGGDVGRTLTSYNAGPRDVSPAGSAFPYINNWANAGNPKARVSDYISNVTDTAGTVAQQNAFGNYTGQALTPDSPATIAAIHNIAKAAGISPEQMSASFGFKY